jgi:serine phosphatase RsbU (regulator of sigma subunit)
VTEIQERDTAAEHAARLQDVTAGLAAAATTAEIADVIISQGIPALSARTGILGVLERPDELRFVASVGYGDVFPERLKLDEPWPIAAAVRTRGIIELRDLPERRAAYAVPEAVWEVSGHGTLVAVPLIVRDQVVGALGFTREESLALTPDERRLVETLAGLAAQALERASLYEADRRARQQAEGLQRVSSAVSIAVTMHDVAEAVASEALAVLSASGVTVVLSRAEDEFLGDVLASRGTVAAYATSQPVVNLQGDTVTAACIRDRQALYAETLEQLEGSWPASAGIARQMELGAIACVPLQVHERRGALSVVFDEPRPFEQEDRTFLFLLARTCEQGLLRAALYDAEQSARRRSGILQALSAKLSGAVELSDVGSAFLEQALDHVGAGSGSLLLADPESNTLVATAIGGSGATRSRWLTSLDADGAYVAAGAYRRGEPVSAATRADLERDFPATAERFGATAQAAYAGPLTVGNRRLGSFGLVFEQERRVLPEDERLLATMADLCAQAIERARLYESERRIAYRLQRALLPEDVVRDPDVELTAHYQAGSERMEIGGDWYDTFRLPDGRIGIAVGDVVGHGIEAAAAMGRLRSAFAAYALESASPADVLSRLNRFAAGPGDVGFATACYAILDPRSGRIVYSSAGHLPILIVDPSGDVRWLDGGHAGALTGNPYFAPDEASDEIERGALLVAYSDGLVERRGESLDAGLGRLADAVRALRELPVEELCTHLVQQAVSPSAQSDDIVVVAARRRSADG